DQSGHGPAVRQRHARHYLALAEAAEPHLRTAGRETWLLRLDRDADNLRAALAWCRDSGTPAGAAPGLRLAGALGWRCPPRGRFQEGRAWLEALRALPAAGDHGGLARGMALHAAGILAWAQGDFAAAAAHAEAGAAVFRAAGDELRLAYAEVLLGRARSAQG